MALAVPNQNTATGGVTSTQQQVTPAANSWLMCVVTVKTTDGSFPGLSVADYARNVWTLAYSGLDTAEANTPDLSLFTQVWVCPRASYVGWPQLNVYVTLLYGSASDTCSMISNVFEVTGMVNGFLTVDSVVSSTVAAATGASIALPTPSGGADCLMVAVAGTDNTAATYTLTSAGWTALTVVTNAGPNVRMAPVWRESTAGRTASWTSSVAVNWVLAAVAIRVTGTAPSQPNTHWPALEFQVGLGFDVSTPINGVVWTPMPDRLMQFDTERGYQYELGEAQSSPTDLTLRNDDGVFTPQGRYNTSLYTTVAGGTTTSLVLSNTDGAKVGINDFFTLLDSTGSPKETTVFRVTAIAVATNTTLTFARADGVAGGAKVATVINDDYRTALLDVYTPYRIMASWNGTRYPVACGWVERWPSQWTDPHWGVIQAVGVDPLATMVAADVPSVAGEILVRNPSFFWPLNDAAGQASALDLLGSGLALVPTTSTAGAGAAGSADFGATTQGTVSQGSIYSHGPYSAGSIIGGYGTAWAMAGLVQAEMPTKGIALVGSPGNNATFPSVTNGVTICGMMFLGQTDSDVRTAATGRGTVMVIRSSTGTGAAATLLSIGIQATTDPNGGMPRVTVWDKTSHASTSTNISNVASVNNHSGFWIFWAITFNATSWMYAGSIGGTTPTNIATTTGTCNLPSSFGLIDIGGEADSTTSANFFNGSHANIAMFPRRLSINELYQINLAMASGQFQFHATNDAINRKLAFVDWPGTRALTWTSYDVGSDLAGDSTVVAKIQAIAGYEGGRLFTDAGGVLQFRGIDAAATQTSRATLGDRPDLGEIPYEGDDSSPVVDYDSTFIYNAITVQNIGIVAVWNPSANTLIYRQSAGTESRYGTRTLTVQTNLANAANVQTLLSNLVLRYGVPKLRVQSVKINVVASQQWVFALSVEVGDVVTFTRRPIGNPNVISFDCVVLSVQHTVDPPDQWDLVLTLAPR